VVWFKKKIDGKTATEWGNTAVTFCRTGQYEEAIVCFDKALKLDSKHKWARDIIEPLSTIFERLLDDENVQIYAIQLIEKLIENTIEINRTVPLFVRCLSHSNPSVRGNAAISFGNILNSEKILYIESLEPLSNCLSDTNPDVQRNALDAISSITVWYENKEIHTISINYSDDDPKVLLTNFLSETLSKIIPFLSNNDVNNRDSAIVSITHLAVAGIADGNAVQQIIPLLSDGISDNLSHYPAIALQYLATAGIIEVTQAYDALQKDVNKGNGHSVEALEEVKRLIKKNPKISKDMMQSIDDLTQNENKEGEISSKLSISRATEFFEGFIRLKMSVLNNSPFVITDTAIDFNFDNDLLRIDRYEPDYQIKNGRTIFGNISANSSKTIAVYFDPMICSKGTDINCQVNYKDAKGQPQITHMEPKKISVVCPIMETDSDINIGRLKEFIEKLPYRDSKVYQVQNGFDIDVLKNISREIVQKHDVKHIRTLFTKDGGTCEIWYYGKTKVHGHNIVIKITILSETQNIELFAATQTMESLAGLLAEIGRELKGAIESKVTGNIQQVINVSIKDSIVQRSNLLSHCDINGNCSGDVVIEDSLVRRLNIGVDAEVKGSGVQHNEIKVKDGKNKNGEEKLKIEQKCKQKEDIQENTKPKIFTNSIGIEFVQIPIDEGQKSTNHVNKPYYIGLYPVTQRQWKEIMENIPSNFENEDYPIEYVSWHDVQRFLQKLNEFEGVNKYRLPSEAEWEYAACAGTDTRYFFGDDETHINDYVWYKKNSEDGVHQVGQKKPNQWGLYDMLGNVWEFVQGENNNDHNKISKGGSWRDHGWYCSSFEQRIIHEDEHFNNLSFRLVKDY